MRRSNAEKSLKPLVISWMVGVVIAGATQMAEADFTIQSAALQSTGPCLFVEHLQESEPARNQYIKKLIAAIRETVSANNLGIDTLSADCLSCHDGAVALSVTAILRYVPLAGSRTLVSDQQMHGMNHPIGMNYNKYATVNKEFKPLFSISDKMVFVNGKVGCLTCHDPQNPEKGHLVMSSGHSTLCVTCHN